MLHRLLRDNSFTVRLLSILFVQDTAGNFLSAMSNLLYKSIFHLLLLRIVAAQDKGQFITPSFSNGSNVFEVGERIEIAWVEFEDYTLLSLGILQENLIIEWLISNSVAYANPFPWTVETFGRDISKPFAFYIVNGTNFGSPFTSASFRIDDPSSSSASASYSSSTVSSTLSSTPSSAVSGAVSSSATQTPQSAPQPIATQVPSGLGAGDKAGIGVGVALAFMIGAAVGWLIFRRSRQSHPSRSGTQNPDAHDQHTSSAPYEKDSSPSRKAIAQPLVELG